LGALSGFWPRNENGLEIILFHPGVGPPQTNLRPCRRRRRTATLPRRSG